MTKYDNTAWKQIRSRPVPTGDLANHFGLALSGRPSSFVELENVQRETGNFELALSEFLNEFYLFRKECFFVEEPSDYFDANTRAWFAGVVEYLCHRFELIVPSWTEKPEYFLPQPIRKSYDDSGDPEFRRRNILYSPRHLIRL